MDLRFAATAAVFLFTEEMVTGAVLIKSTDTAKRYLPGLAGRADAGGRRTGRIADDGDARNGAGRLPEIAAPPRRRAVRVRTHTRARPGRRI